MGAGRSPSESESSLPGPVSVSRDTSVGALAHIRVVAPDMKAANHDDPIVA